MKSDTEFPILHVIGITNISEPKEVRQRQVMLHVCHQRNLITLLYKFRLNYWSHISS